MEQRNFRIYLNPVEYDKLRMSQSEKTKTLKLSKGQLCAHYAVVPFLLIMPLLTTYSLFQIYVAKNYTGVRKPYELIDGYLWIIPAIFFYFVQKRRLQFREIKIKVDSNTFKKAAESTAAKLIWIIKHESNDYIVAIRKGSLSTGGSWGEMITIIRNENKVLINSICDPGNIISIASYGWNKKNIRTFEMEIKGLIQL